MELGYPVNDYRGYLAHAIDRQGNARRWKESSNHQYSRREWKNDHWVYYYDEPGKQKAGKRVVQDADKAANSYGNYKPITGTSLGPNKTENKKSEPYVSDEFKQEVEFNTKKNNFKSNEKMTEPMNVNGQDIPSYKVETYRESRADGMRNSLKRMGEGVSDAYDAVSQAIVDGADWVKNFGEEQGRVFDVEERFENGETIEVKTYANTIAGNTARIANDIVSWVKQAFTDVSAFVLKGSSSIKKWVGDTVGSISDFYTNQVRPFVNGIITQIKNSDQYKTITGAFSTAFGAIVSAAGTALSAIGSAADSVAGFAADIFNGFGEILGITGQVNDALNKRGGHGGNY